MKKLIALASLLLTLSVTLLSGCGGGGGGDSSPPVVNHPPPITQVYPIDNLKDFDPRYDSSGGAVVVHAADRTAYWNYTWTPGRSHGGGGVGAENFRLAQCVGNERWNWLDGYSNGPPGSLTDSTWPTWPVDMIKGDWTNLDTGEVRDITHLCGGPYPYGGQPGIPYDLPKSGRYQIRVWGWIYNGPPPAERARPYFWQAEYTFGTKEFNPCWHGEGPSTREVIIQKEAWWDPTDKAKVGGGIPSRLELLGGWELALKSTSEWVRGQTANPPYNAKGEPQDPGPATYTASYSFGAGKAGLLWTIHDEKGNFACLESSTVH